MTSPSERLGLRKQGKYNHLCNLLKEKGIKFNPKDIADLSTSQMRKRIDELKGTTQGRKNCYESRGRVLNDI